VVGRHRGYLALAGRADPKAGGPGATTALFGTDGKVKRSVESGALSALNSAKVQAALNYAVAQCLQAKGVTGRLLSVQMTPSDMVVTAL
jgi:hypothetical protein